MCLDACFTQKRRLSAKDPEHHHPTSVFLSPEKVKQAEDLVMRLRGTRQAGDTDSVLPGMQLPAATLQECHDSFKAADERHVKASTQFFSDTGLMALVCRHDIVLWMVNMTSPGERQHYALALLLELLSHLPKTMTVGLLYDFAVNSITAVSSGTFWEKIYPGFTLESQSSMPLLTIGPVNWSITQENVKVLVFLMVKDVRGCGVS